MEVVVVEEGLPLQAVDLELDLLQQEVHQLQVEGLLLVPGVICG